MANQLATDYMKTAMGRVSTRDSIYPSDDGQYSYVAGTQGNAARKTTVFTSQANNPDLKNKLNDTLYKRIAQQVGIKNFSSWDDVKRVEDFLAREGSSKPDSKSNSNSAMAVNFNSYQQQLGKAMGLKSVNSDNDLRQISEFAKKNGINQVNSQKDLDQLLPRLNQQSTQTAQESAQPAQQPANQTFNPADYAPTNTAPAEEKPTYLESKTTEYESSPQSSVYDDFLKAVQDRDAKVASGEAGALDSIDKVASGGEERTWDSYAKEWGVSSPSNTSTSTDAGRMAGGDDFMGKLLAAGGVSGYADDGDRDKRRYMN